jgi:ParB family chromosome partitioning protein
MSTQRGLGRGLDALLGGMNKSAEPGEIINVPIDKIIANPNQPRVYFDDEALKDLAASIQESGVLQPVLVRPKKGEADGSYELIAGERRLRAGKLADLRLMPAIVREMSDEESLAVALVENLQREDLNPIEEAKGLFRLQTEFSLTQDDLSKKVGKSRSAVANIMRLLQLSQDMQDDVGNGKISAGHARSLLAIDDELARGALHAAMLENKLSVRDSENAAAHWKKTGSLPFDVTQQKSPARSNKPSNTMDMEALQQELSDRIGLPTRMNGTLRKGTIRFSYNNTEQLADFLQSLGMEPEDINAAFGVFSNLENDR